MAWSWGSFLEYLTSPYLLAGAWTTLWLTCASMAIGVALGLLAALMQLTRNSLLRSSSACWRPTASPPSTTC